MPGGTLLATLVLAGAQLRFPIVPAGGSPVPDAEREAIREDAAILAARFVITDGGDAALEVPLPPELLDSLNNAIGRVHGLRDSSRDDVVERYRVRALPSPSTREVVIVLEWTPPWAEAWRRGEAMTGNASVDAVVRAHDLELESFRSFPILAIAVLRSETPVNTRALASRFEGIAGVKSAFGNSSAAWGIQRDIHASVAADGWRLDFSVGWGDCPSGCINRHTWSFHVATTGRVESLGRSGTGPPSDEELASF